MNREIGIYVNRKTGDRFTVIERSRDRMTTNLKGGQGRRQGAIDYITSCGKDLNPVGKDLAAFSLLISGEVIHKEDQ